MEKESQEEILKSLVHKASKGDRRAFGKIFKICYEDIYDYIIRRVGNISDAEDLTMTVFVQGLKGISKYEERGHSVKAWLYRIAHNAVIDHFRIRKKLTEIGGLPEIADPKDFQKEVSTRDELRGLYREIRQLPKAQAEVLILRFMKDMSVSETAMILDKKEVTVRALQFKGIKNLRERIKETSV